MGEGEVTDASGAFVPLPRDPAQAALQARRFEAILAYLCEQLGSGHGYADNPHCVQMELRWENTCRGAQPPSMIDRLSVEAAAYWQNHVDLFETDDRDDFDRACLARRDALVPIGGPLTLHGIVYVNRRERFDRWCNEGAGIVIAQMRRLDDVSEDAKVVESWRCSVDDVDVGKRFRTLSGAARHAAASLAKVGA